MADINPMETRPSFSLRVLLALIRFVYRAPYLVVVVAVASFAGCLLLASLRLEFATDRAALVDQNERFAQLARRFQAEFPESEDLVVLVDGGTSDQREHFVDDLAKRLLEKPELYKEVFTKVELPFLRSHALSYLDVEDLKLMTSSLQEAKGMLQALTTQAGMGEMLAQTSRDLEKMLPILNEVLGQLLKSLETRGRFHYVSPWARAFFEGADQKAKAADSPDLVKEANKTAFYNTLANGRQHLALVKPGHDTDQAIRTLRKEVRRLRTNYPDLDIGITGELVLDLDEMESSIKDASLATVWSLCLISVLFVASFGRMWRPAMALFSLTLALGWTLGFTTVAVGHLNLLTVTFATMLIGLGVDFAIHFIFGYQEMRFLRNEPLQAMEKTMEHAGVESMTGAVTTAVAFYAIRFTSFRGVAELGLIAGTGVLFCFVAMVVVLPALIFIQERYGTRIENPRPFWAGALEWAEGIILGRPWVALGFCLFVTAWAVSRVQDVKFDYNLLNLQSRSLPSVQTELKLLGSEGHGVLFAVSLADNIEEAKRKSEQFTKLPSVSNVESILPLIPTDYDRKKPWLEEVERLMSDVPLPNPKGPSDSGSRSGLMKMGEGFQLLEKTFSQALPVLLHSPDPEVRSQTRRFQSLLDRLFKTLEKMGPGPISDSVSTFQELLYSDLHDLLGFLKSQRAEPQVTLDSLPPSIRSRSVGKTGKLLLRIYPAGNPWEREPLTRFVDQLQKVDPEVIGTPVMIYYHTKALKDAYEVSGWYALGAICIILLLHFRNLKNSLLALMPKLTGVIWMLGAMSYYKVDFNPANFMALPLILGIGLIFGVHVVHRLLHDPEAGVFSHSTGPAVALSAASTIVGFGTLMFAQHQGIASLGFLMAAGVGANVVTSLVLLPAVMRLLARRKPQGAEQPA